MNAQETRQDAIRATRGQMRRAGGDPKTATAYEIEMVCDEVRQEFANNCSDNQWKLFIREFKKWQRQLL